MAVRGSKAAAANRAYRTGAAGLAPLPVAAGALGVVDPRKVAIKDIADPGREFAAGVNLAIGKEGKEIKCSSTAITGAASKKISSFSKAQNIDEVVF